MPTYVYACTSCGESLEAVQKFSDEPLTECPACGGRLRKVFSPVGVVFKGSGFYKTDSRGSARKPPAESSKKSDDASGTGSDSTKKETPKESSSTSSTATTSGSSSSSGQVA